TGHAGAEPGIAQLARVERGFHGPAFGRRYAQADACGWLLCAQGEPCRCVHTQQERWRIGHARADERALESVVARNGGYRRHVQSETGKAAEPTGSQQAGRVASQLRHFRWRCQTFLVQVVVEPALERIALTLLACDDGDGRSDE